jgi:perosamine synthetase
MVPLHEPELSSREKELVTDCIDSTFVSSVGHYVDRFEEMLEAYTGARRAIAVSNGTVALQVALHLAGVKAGDEVLVPSLSFVATANAVAHCGAVPHFVDSCSVTLGLAPAALRDYLDHVAESSLGQLRNRETGRRIAAVVPMHTYGHPVDMAELMEFAGRMRIPIVEDAAESLGSWCRDQHTGTIGRLGALSFNGNKIITTGGGGAILTNDDDLATRAKHLTTTAKLPHRWAFSHDEVAWNFRLPNLNAALGCAQMERLPKLIECKRRLADRYRQAFAGNTMFEFVTEPLHTCSNYWLNTIRLKSPRISIRDRMLAAANDAGYQCRPTWTLLHRLPMYKDCPRAPLPVASALEASLMNLPSSAHLAGELWP